jgi:RNA polymerase sigma factor (TIGR02999 family)
MEIAQAASITGHRHKKPVIQPSRCYASAFPSNSLKNAPMVSPGDVTALLGDWSRGNRTALDQLLPLVYAELRRVATRQLRNERADHTLQPTALVHEVYIRLVGQRQVDWQNRAHFFGVAAQVMRRILVDNARRHGASKRGEGVRCVSIDEAKDVAASNGIPILALDQALAALEKVDSELARIVELRAFGGLTIEEAAHVLNVSPSTAKRDWRTAKAWLNRELGSEVRP